MSEQDKNRVWQGDIYGSADTIADRYFNPLAPWEEMTACTDDSQLCEVVNALQPD